MPPKEDLLKMAVEDFLKWHEGEYKDPKAPKEYVRPFEGEPDFLAVQYVPTNEPEKVVFVLRSGHKYIYKVPAEKPAAPARAGGGRAAREVEGEAAGAG